MYRFTPDEIDHERAHHQAVIQGADDLDVKRIGNLGELAFEQFCREYLPVEMWDWENEEAIRRCNSESFSGHDFEVFGYTVDDNVTVAFLGDFEEGVPLRELRSTVRRTALRATGTGIQS